LAAAMSKIRWGVLGVAQIAVEHVIPGMQQGANCEVAAIASRTLEKARQAASRLGIRTAYGSYDALLADPDIQAVYIPLPNHLHVPWSIKALEAGKHVLCEKPIALSVAEAQSLVEAGLKHPKLKLMEGFMYRHHPQWLMARRLVDEGHLGELRTIQTFFSYYDRNPNDVRNQPGVGGGGLMDIGCYPISLSRFLFRAEPRRVMAQIELDPDFQVDRLVSGMMDFERGQSSFVVGIQLAPFQRVQIVGTAGRVAVEIPFNAPEDRPTSLWYQRGAQLQEIRVDTCHQYRIQGELFSRAILEDLPVPTPITDAVDNMRVIEAMFRSGESGRWETP
jgi:predicted dehydrogenase